MDTILVDYMCFTVIFHRLGRKSICAPSICFKFGAASELKVRFRANKTG